MNSNVNCIAIDDEPLALEIIEKFCTRMDGFALRTYSDPEEGLAAILQERPDIVFLDIEMETSRDLPLHASCLRRFASFSRLLISTTHLKASILMSSTIFTSHSHSAVSRPPAQKPCAESNLMR